MTTVLDRPQPKKGGDPVDAVRMLSMPASRFEYRTESPTSDGRIGTLFGYASVFNEWTEIESWEGHFLERIAPGAFAKTLRDHGDQVKILFNHGLDPQIGEKPLGRPKVMREDNRGLYVEVPLDDTSYNRDLLASLKSGAIDGMSFSFRVGEDQIVERTPDKREPPVAWGLSPIRAKRVEWLPPSRPFGVSDTSDTRRLMSGNPGTCNAGHRGETPNRRGQWEAPRVRFGGKWAQWRRGLGQWAVGLAGMLSQAPLSRQPIRLPVGCATQTTNTDHPLWLAHRRATPRLLARHAGEIRHDCGLLR